FALPLVSSVHPLAFFDLPLVSSVHPLAFFALPLVFVVPPLVFFAPPPTSVTFRTFFQTKPQAQPKRSSQWPKSSPLQGQHFGSSPVCAVHRRPAFARFPRALTTAKRTP